MQTSRNLSAEIRGELVVETGLTGGTVNGGRSIPGKTLAVLSVLNLNCYNLEQITALGRRISG